MAETSAIIYLLVSLQVADVLSTLYAFKNGAVEGNPVMAWFIMKLGTMPGLMIPKLVYCVLLFYFINDLTPIVIVVVGLFYAFVIYNNIRLGMKR